MHEPKRGRTARLDLVALTKLYCDSKASRMEDVTSMQEDFDLLLDVMQMCPVAIVFYDSHGEAVLWNDEAENLSVLPSFKISPEERDHLISCYTLEGKRIPPEELPSKVAILEGYAERDMIVSSMGHQEKFRVRARAIYDQDGKLRGSVLVWNRLSDVKEGNPVSARNGKGVVTAYSPRVAVDANPG